MRIKELIEQLKQYPEDANVVVCGNGKGGSPYIDIKESDIELCQDCEVGESQVPCTIHTNGNGVQYRKVVVLFESPDLY